MRMPTRGGAQRIAIDREPTSSLKRTTSLVVVLTAIVSPAPANAKEPTQLAWPVDCAIGGSCEIQHYVDHGGGGAAKDYRCGTATYKGHNGTDIRLRTMAAERAGVDVLAAAPGRVLRARDNMADVSVRVVGQEAIRGRQCGNGLVIAHTEGLETQYCHMARGSLVVKAGDVVSQGQKLGHVGLSGDTEFPHLHITVRRNGKLVDPFAEGEAEGACAGGTPLWQPTVQRSLAYKTGVVLNHGFADRSVTMEDIENGVGTSSFATRAPALVAFARAITLRKGDVQHLVLRGPRGVLVDRMAPPLPANEDQVFLGIGRKKPADNWPAGLYSADYSVMRDGKVVIAVTFTAQVGP